MSPLGQSKRVLGGIDETPVEVAAKVVERDDVVSRQLGEASLDGGQRCRVRQDLRGLFERFVFVEGEISRPAGRRTVRRRL